MNALENFNHDAPVVAIVHFLSDEALVPMGKRLVYYQVTIPVKGNTELRSPSGEFIYLGGTQGDQITGWQPENDIVVDEILHTYAEDEIVPYLPRLKVEKADRTEEELKPAYECQECGDIGGDGFFTMDTNKNKCDGCYPIYIDMMAEKAL